MKKDFLQKVPLKFVLAGVLIILTISWTTALYITNQNKQNIALITGNPDNAIYQTTIVLPTASVLPSSDERTNPTVILPSDIYLTPTTGIVDGTTVPTVTLTPTPGRQSGWPTPTPTFTPTPTATNTPTPTPTFSPTPTPEVQSAYVAFYADPQSDTDEEDTYHQRVVNYILARGANPIFNAGDLLEDGTAASLTRFNNVTATLRSTRTFYSALGNNDRVEGDPSTPSAIFLNNFSFPGNERWYSVNVGNLHMVVLDSAFASSSQTQKDWLAADLQSAASQDRITGVIFHHPSYAATISSYLINYNVDFVIMGHNHAYQYYTSNGVDFFILSGQPNIGYITARVYSSYATLSVFNQNNGTITNITVDNR